MRRILAITALAAFTIVMSAPSVTACWVCSGGAVQSRQTLRQDAGTAKIVIFGTLTNTRLNANGNGETDVAIQTVVKSDPFLGGAKTITIPRYMPFDAKQPPTYLIFCDVYQNKLDPYRGTPIKGPAVVEYIKGALAIDEKERSKALEYHFRFLDSADPDVSADAFLEFAKASDQEIGKVAPSLDPAKLRKLLTDPQTTADRLGLFAYMLGACGKASDANVLAELIRKTDDRTRSALSGLLGGYVQLQSEAGWAEILGILTDAKRPFNDRLAALNTLRFFHSWKPDEYYKQILNGLEALTNQGDMADMAVEDLRRWKWWELTNTVLAQYDKKSHSAPLVRRAILRYALSCPKHEAKAFVAKCRQVEPKTVQEVEEALEFERPVPAKPKQR
jgi:hypothetical protein